MFAAPPCLVLPAPLITAEAICYGRQIFNLMRPAYPPCKSCSEEKPQARHYFAHRQREVRIISVHLLRNPTFARPARWAPWDSMYTRYWLKSRNSSIVGRNVMIFREGLPGVVPPVPAMLTLLLFTVWKETSQIFMCYTGKTTRPQMILQRAEPPLR